MSCAVHFRTCSYALGHPPMLSVVTSLISVITMSSAGRQLSVKVGSKASAKAMPAASSHSRVVSAAPTAWSTTGAVVSMTVIVCVYSRLTLPHISCAVHFRTCSYALGHPPMLSVVTSLISVITMSSAGRQLSVNVGSKASAKAIPAASSHSSVVSASFTS